MFCSQRGKKCVKKIIKGKRYNQLLCSYETYAPYFKTNLNLVQINNDTKGIKNNYRPSFLGQNLALCTS